jgi:hypothetical protein
VFTVIQLSQVSITQFIASVSGALSGLLGLLTGLLGAVEGYLAKREQDTNHLPDGITHMKRFSSTLKLRTTPLNNTVQHQAQVDDDLLADALPNAPIGQPQPLVKPLKERLKGLKHSVLVVNESSTVPNSGRVPRH